jgi:spore coat polysaccharide biosynthesis protein SpsF
MKNVAVVQARMGSTRLPGKVLMQIGTKTTLGHLISRLERCASLDSIMVATTTHDSDDAIANFAQSQGIEVLRGSESNVLSRYVNAATQMEASNVLRITADCPFIDPELIDELFSMFISENLDHCGIASGAGVSNPAILKFPHGMDSEWIKANALVEAHKNSQDPFDLEHVTPYIWRNRDKFRTGVMQASEDFSDVRVTLDTPEDFNVLNVLAEKLASTIGTIGYRDLSKEYRGLLK